MCHPPQSHALFTVTLVTQVDAEARAIATRLGGASVALQALQAVPDDNQVHTQAHSLAASRDTTMTRETACLHFHTQTQMDALAFFATLASDNACAEVMGPVEGADKISEVPQPHKQQTAVAYSHVALSHTQLPSARSDHE